ncbi:thioredoxin domain-containing protein [Microbacterium resistens]|uniref:Thioredoxin domain-containing protein n=1 Tax=Microbacterium resistens TaxID=156977 RepID=A0ABY3RT54_9MICO|nr:thioredoxin domain-containing protein [Microbacterium resistens]UGS27253.1 thioredoxin domain-containing protein [Microbacterium resistens]
MNRTLRAILVAVGAAVVLLLGGLLFVLATRGAAPEAMDPAADPTASVVRDDSHVLGEEGDGRVTVVEFLDFECEACGAFYPVVENLRAEYAGEITYVVRYFPLPGHVNAMNAAVAVEAAAQQGRFEDMYHQLFRTQAEWGEAPAPDPAVFRAYAQELGLDMASYDRAVADPATTERVNRDVEDGRALGITGTPTFFLNGEQVALQRFDDLGDAVRDAVGGR